MVLLGPPALLVAAFLFLLFAVFPGGLLWGGLDCFQNATCALGSPRPPFRVGTPVTG